MLSVFLSWLLIILVFFSFGDAFVCLYNKVTKRAELYTFVETFFIGLVVSCTIIGLLSLKFAANMTMALVFAAFSIVYLAVVKTKSIRKNLGRFISHFSYFDYLLVLLGVVILMLFALIPPQFPDVYIYHIQNMMWNEEYSVVPGLANIEERFGFNSNIFLLYPVFGIRPLVGGYVYGFNAICLLFVLLFIISQFINRRTNLGILFLLLFLLFIISYRMHVGCSTDLLPNLLILFLLFVILVDPKNIGKKSLLFWLVPLLCITLKLSAIFICLLTLYLFIYFYRKKIYQADVFITVMAVFVIVPWLVRNVIISGYLIYPYPAIDLFNYDWKLPIQYVINSKQYIEAFAITMDVWGSSNEEILTLPFYEKAYRWLVDKDFMDIGFVILGLFSLIFMFILILKKSVPKNTHSSILLLIWVAGFMGFLFMLIMAPAVRFALSFIIITIVIPFCLFFQHVKKKEIAIIALKQFSKYSTAVFLFLFLCLGIVSVRAFRAVKADSMSYVDLLFKPQGVETRSAIFPIEKKCQYLNDIPFWIITKESCYDTPLPCLNGVGILDKLEMRGETLQEGFRTKK